MLRSEKGLRGCVIQAEDGELGHVDGFFFDDVEWTARYLVVNTGVWLFGRRVLIPPVALGEVDWQNHRLHVSLTREQVENSPEIDTDQPVSQRQERGYVAFFGWPFSWADAGPGVQGAPGIMAVPGGEARDTAEETATEPDPDADYAPEHDEPRVRSTRSVAGAHLLAYDGEIGRVDDFILDDETWAIRYLVADTGNWWPGKKVLLPPACVEHVSWPERTVEVSLTREQLQGAPEWDAGAELTRDYETRLYDHFRRPKYWERPSQAAGG